MLLILKLKNCMVSLMNKPVDLFEMFVQYHVPVIAKFSDDEYSFCDGTPCGFCEVTHICGKMFLQVTPCVNESDLTKMKEKYPECFI